MAGRILVVYATRYGSTRVAAEKVGAKLREQGLDVDVVSVDRVESVRGYDAVVLGTAFYIGSIITEAKMFLERGREALDGVPVALFAMGPASGDEDIEVARERLVEDLATIPWFKPEESEVFIGKHDPAKLNPADRVLSVLPADPLGPVRVQDVDDWSVIEEWAEKLQGVLF